MLMRRQGAFEMEMDKNQTHGRFTGRALIILYVFIVLSLALAIGRTVLISNHYNTSTGYYDGEGSFDTLINVAVNCVIVLGILSALMFARKIAYKDSARDGLTIAAGVLAFALGMTGAVTYFFEASAVSSKPAFGVITEIFAFLAAAFFAYAAWSEFTKKRNVLVWTVLCLCAVAFCIFNMLRLYFDLGQTMNNPAKIAEQVMMVAFVPYLMLDCRMKLGTGRPAALFGFGLAALAASCYSVIPDILVRVLYNYRVNTSLSAQLIALGILIYTLLSLLSYALRIIPAEVKEKDTEDKQSCDPESAETDKIEGPEA